MVEQEKNNKEWKTISAKLSIRHLLPFLPVVWGCLRDSDFFIQMVFSIWYSLRFVDERLMRSPKKPARNSCVPMSMVVSAM